MSTIQEEILKLEGEAQELVSNLRVLHEKIGSYHKAKETLEITNTSLLSLIDETKTLSEESHRIIAAINQIGSSEIFLKLDDLAAFEKENLNLIKNDISSIAIEINKRLDKLNEDTQKSIKLIESQNKNSNIIIILGFVLVVILEIVHFFIK